MNKICKDYISEVKALFPVMGKEEKAYIQKLKSNLEDYCSEAQVASKEDLYKNYSTPSQVVTDYFSNADTEYLLKKVRFAKFVKWAVIAILAIAVVGVSIYCMHIYEEYQALNKVANDMTSAMDSLNNIL